MHNEQKIEFIKEILEDKYKWIVGFEKEPNIGDKFTIGEKTATFGNREYKIKVL